jgi:hypothetical protein
MFVIFRESSLNKRISPTDGIVLLHTLSCAMSEPMLNVGKILQHFVSSDGSKKMTK